MVAFYSACIATREHRKLKFCSSRPDALQTRRGEHLCDGGIFHPTAAAPKLKKRIHDPTLHFGEPNLEHRTVDHALELALAVSDEHAIDECTRHGQFGFDHSQLELSILHVNQT